jgi:membrane peptidoglycan carboxypeptidase
VVHAADDIAIGTPVPARRRPFRARLPHFRPRHVVIASAVAALLLAVVAAVPPLRRAAALGLGNLIVKLASPLAPSVRNFGDLPQPTKIVASDGSVLTVLDDGQRRDPVLLKDLPPDVPHAVLAAEDANFYHHAGFDPTGVMRALVHTAQGHTQGGSTITQQLAKINYTGSRRTALRKLKELEYAVRLEKRYSKDQLLERYLNQVYFGDGAYGIAAASQTFFGVPPQQLTPAQAATLAGKIESPEGLDPRRNPAPVQARRDQVLRNMHKHHWLSKADLAAALGTPLQVIPEPPADTTQLKAPHFVEYVKREAAGLDALGGSADSRRHQLYAGGLTIETTLDPKMYDAAVSTVQATLNKPGDPATAMVSVQPGDGAIRMLFGGLTFDRKFDLASQGRRQPGSSFKPYVLLAAIRQGVSPASQLPADSPQTLNYKGHVFQVKNYEGGGHGKSDLDNAMAHSINVVYARLGIDIGLSNVVQTAEAAGISHQLDRDRDNPAISLGGLTKGVSPLEQAAAYATFAAKGVYAEPYSIARIRDRNGRVIYTRDPKTRQVFSDKEVGVLNHALMGVVDHGTGTAAALNRPVAGKTGTTENYGDAWFVGFVPQLATAVWVGYPDGVVPMTHVHGIKVAGGTFPAMMFGRYMTQATDGMPVKDIFTATPDQLGLHLLTDSQTPTTSSSDTTTSSSTTTSTSTSLPGTTTSTALSPSTTTTTTAKKQTTTTTSSTTTTTTAATNTNATTTTTAASP